MRQHVDRQPLFSRLLLLGFLIFATPGAAQAESCRNETFRGASYIVCSFDPAKDGMRLFWRGADGQPYRTFGALAAALEQEGRTLHFAMNGGMYQDDLSPVGLHVEQGRQLTPADTTTLTGPPSRIPNFYKKPNGVFYLGEGSAGVLATEKFLAKKPNASFATQSGPMLVIDGAIHPAFIVDSKDLKPRNGVGVSGAGKAHFVITRGSVSFYEFARFFRDGLETKNALFLDGGSAPGLYAPELGRDDPPSHGGYGPIIAVVE